MSEDRAGKFLKKLDQQTAEVNLYFSREISVENVSMLSKNTNTPVDYWDNLITDVIINDFNLLALDNRLSAELGVDHDKALKYTQDFIGIVLLPIAGYIKTAEIEKELVRYGAKKGAYLKYVEEFDDYLDEEKNKIINKIIEDREKTFDVELESKTVYDLFENSLKVILADGHPDALLELNGGLIFLLFHKMDFKEELLKIIFNNTEIITTGSIRVGGVISEPTIGSWLNDFVKTNGGGNFSNLAISQYLAKSENCKKLNEKEKGLISQLLNLYRNIKMFPESMGITDPALWQIVPVNKELNNKNKISINKKTEGAAGRLQELQEIAEQFAPGSLERKAVEAEIKKLVN